MSQTEGAIRSVVAIHALSLGLKLKKKVDVNEKYPVSAVIFVISLKHTDAFEKRIFHFVMVQVH